EAEERALLDYKKLLTEREVPTAPRAASFFISARLINELLKAVEGAVIEPEGQSGITVRVDSVRADFGIGYPLLNVEAVAVKDALALELSTVARLVPTPFSGNPPKLALEIHVDSLVPRARWGPWNF